MSTDISLSVSRAELLRRPDLQKEIAQYLLLARAPRTINLLDEHIYLHRDRMRPMAAWALTLIGDTRYIRVLYVPRKELQRAFHQTLFTFLCLSPEVPRFHARGLYFRWDGEKLVTPTPKDLALQ